jgi:hypothetical protein
MNGESKGSGRTVDQTGSRLLLSFRPSESSPSPAISRHKRFDISTGDGVFSPQEECPPDWGRADQDVCNGRGVPGRAEAMEADGSVFAERFDSCRILQLMRSMGSGARPGGRGSVISDMLPLANCRRRKGDVIDRLEFREERLFPKKSRKRLVLPLKCPFPPTAEGRGLAFYFVCPSLVIFLFSRIIFVSWYMSS